LRCTDTLGGVLKHHTENPAARDTFAKLGFPR